jgi:hypothetical protein
MYKSKISKNIVRTNEINKYMLINKINLILLICGKKVSFNKDP